MAQRRRENNFLLYLFTFGVLGWGFFAIARLTENVNSQLIKNFEKKEKVKENTFLNNWKAWLLEKLKNYHVEKPSMKLHTLSRQEGKLSRIEEEIPLIEDPIEKENFLREEEESEGTSEEKKKQKIYLYQLNKKGEVELKGILREVKPTIKAAIEAVISGPTKAEEGRDFIDSFPTKPKLLSVTKEGDTLILNFDSKFGLGVSYNTLKYQIQQLYYTAREFPGVKAISLRVEGSYQKHIGGDGIAIPQRIDINTLKTF